MRVGGLCCTFSISIHMFRILQNALISWLFKGCLSTSAPNATIITPHRKLSQGKNQNQLVILEF